MANKHYMICPYDCVLCKRDPSRFVIEKKKSRKGNDKYCCKVSEGTETPCAFIEQLNLTERLRADMEPLWKDLARRLDEVQGRKH